MIRCSTQDLENKNTFTAFPFHVTCVNVFQSLLEKFNIYLFSHSLNSIQSLVYIEPLSFWNIIQNYYIFYLVYIYVSNKFGKPNIFHMDSHIHSLEKCIY